MATFYLADELLPVEVEVAPEDFESFFEPDSPEPIDLEETEPQSHAKVRWGYRVPCAGVRYYFRE